MNLGGTPPIRKAGGKYSTVVMAAVRQELKEQLNAGILEPSDKASGSPVHMVVLYEPISFLSRFYYCEELCG